MFMYYTVCYFSGIFYAVVRQISILFIHNKDSVFCILLLLLLLFFLHLLLLLRLLLIIIIIFIFIISISIISIVLCRL